VKTKTLRFLASLFIAVVLTAVLALAGRAEDDAATASAYLDGVQAYNHGDFSRAVERFEAAAAGDAQNGLLFYNLGNAHLKQGDVGRAILWYERARRLMPGDPDLAFNLQLAREQAVDKAGSEPGALARVLFFWRQALPPAALQWLALAANAAFWLSLGGLVFRRARPLKALCGAALALMLLTMPSVAYDFYDTSLNPKAVVLAESLPVRSGRSDTATELFTLHAGAMVRLEAITDGYARLRLEDGKTGWAKAEGVAQL